MQSKIWSQKRCLFGARLKLKSKKKRFQDFIFTDETVYVIRWRNFSPIAKRQINFYLWSSKRFMKNVIFLRHDKFYGIKRETQVFFVKKSLVSFEFLKQSPLGNGWCWNEPNGRNSCIRTEKSWVQTPPWKWLKNPITMFLVGSCSIKAMKELNG